MKFFWLTMLSFASLFQSNLFGQTICQPLSKPAIQTFVCQGWKYKIYEVKQDTTPPTLIVQRTKNKQCETIFDQYYTHKFQCRDVNGDKWLDLVLEDRKYIYIYLFNPLKGQYIETGVFGQDIGYCDPKWRVNDHFITRFNDKRDVFTYDLYKIVNYKQIVVGRIDFHVLKEEDEKTFVSGIHIFHKPNKSIDDFEDEIPSKTLSFDEVEPRFFKKGRFQKVISHFLIYEFDQDAFVKYYFKKHFKRFVP
jgi:hypothetical protein